MNRIFFLLRFKNRINEMVMNPSIGKEKSTNQYKESTIAN